MTKKKSLGAKYTKVQASIKTYLEGKGVYDDTDAVLIDELVFNLYLADEAKDDIKQRGIMVAINSKIMQTNQAVNIYSQATKNIQTICTKLGITPQERSKFKLLDEPDDGLQAILNFDNGNGTGQKPQVIPVTTSKT